MKLIPEIADIVNLEFYPLSAMIIVVEPDTIGQAIKVWFDEWSHQNMRHQTEAWIPTSWTLA